MAGGEQHAGHGEDALDALVAQLVEAVADDRPREFEEAAGDRILRQPPGDAGRDRGELGDRLVVAAAMAAHHHADLGHLLRSHEWPGMLTARANAAQSAAAHWPTSARYVQSHDTASGPPDRRRGRRPGMALPRHCASGRARRARSSTGSTRRSTTWPDSPAMQQFWGIVAMVFLVGGALTVGWLIEALLSLPAARLGGRCRADEHADRPEQPLSACRRGRDRPGPGRPGRRARRRPACRRPRSGDAGRGGRGAGGARNRWPRTSPTPSRRRCSGRCCWACRASSPTRSSTRPTA